MCQFKIMCELRSEQRIGCAEHRLRSNATKSREVVMPLAELKPALYGVFNRKIGLVTKNALKRQIKDEAI